MCRVTDSVGQFLAVVFEKNIFMNTVYFFIILTYAFCSRSYTRIDSPEQRAQYKKEFNTHYNKYILLHKVLDGVRERFTYLEARLRGAAKGSPQFEVDIFDNTNWHGIGSSNERISDPMGLLHRAVSPLKLILAMCYLYFAVVSSVLLHLG
jgi:hypothetical protein